MKGLQDDGTSLLRHVPARDNDTTANYNSCKATVSSREDSIGKKPINFPEEYKKAQEDSFYSYQNIQLLPRRKEQSYENSQLLGKQYEKDEKAVITAASMSDDAASTCAASSDDNEQKTWTQQIKTETKDGINSQAVRGWSTLPYAFKEKVMKILHDEKELQLPKLSTVPADASNPGSVESLELRTKVLQRSAESPCLLDTPHHPHPSNKIAAQSHKKKSSSTTQYLRSRRRRRRTARLCPHGMGSRFLCVFCRSPSNYRPALPFNKNHHLKLTIASIMRQRSRYYPGTISERLLDPPFAGRMLQNQKLPTPGDKRGHRKRAMQRQAGSQVTPQLSQKPKNTHQEPLPTNCLKRNAKTTTEPRPAKIIDPKGKAKPKPHRSVAQGNLPSQQDVAKSVTTDQKGDAGNVYSRLWNHALNSQVAVEKKEKRKVNSWTVFQRPVNESLWIGELRSWKPENKDVKECPNNFDRSKSLTGFLQPDSINVSRRSVGSNEKPTPTAVSMQSQPTDAADQHFQRNSLNYRCTLKQSETPQFSCTSQKVNPKQASPSMRPQLSCAPQSENVRGTNCWLNTRQSLPSVIHHGKLQGATYSTQQWNQPVLTSQNMNILRTSIPPETGTMTAMHKNNAYWTMSQPLKQTKLQPFYTQQPPSKGSPNPKFPSYPASVVQSPGATMVHPANNARTQGVPPNAAQGQWRDSHSHSLQTPAATSNPAPVMPDRFTSIQSVSWPSSYPQNAPLKQIVEQMCTAHATYNQTTYNQATCNQGFHQSQPSSSSASLLNNWSSLPTSKNITFESRVATKHPPLVPSLKTAQSLTRSTTASTTPQTGLQSPTNTGGATFSWNNNRIFLKTAKVQDVQRPPAHPSKGTTLTDNLTSMAKVLNLPVQSVSRPQTGFISSQQSDNPPCKSLTSNIQMPPHKPAALDRHHQLNTPANFECKSHLVSSSSASMQSRTMSPLTPQFGSALLRPQVTDLKLPQNVL